MEERIQQLEKRIGRLQATNEVFFAFFLIFVWATLTYTTKSYWWGMLGPLLLTGVEKM